MSSLITDQLKTSPQNTRITSLPLTCICAKQDGPMKSYLHIFGSFLRIGALVFSDICMMLGGDKSQKLTQPVFLEIQVSLILSKSFQNVARIKVLIAL